VDRPTPGLPSLIGQLGLGAMSEIGGADPRRGYRGLANTSVAVVCLECLWERPQPVRVSATLNEGVSELCRRTYMTPAQRLKR
jgi:hypothetical protein